MRIVRIVFRVFRLFSMFYMLWRGTRATRVVWLIGVLWRILRRRPALRKPPNLHFTFLDANDERLYRRRGWRRVGTRAEGSNGDR